MHFFKMCQYTQKYAEICNNKKSIQKYVKNIQKMQCIDNYKKNKINAQNMQQKGKKLSTNVQTQCKKYAEI